MGVDASTIVVEEMEAGVVVAEEVVIMEEVVVAEVGEEVGVVIDVQSLEGLIMLEEVVVEVLEEVVVEVEVLIQMAEKGY